MVKTVLLLVASFYFFHPSWYANIPEFNGSSAQEETIFHIKHYNQFNKPHSFYTAGHGLFFQINSLFYKIIKDEIPFKEDLSIYFSSKLLGAFIALISVILFYEVSSVFSAFLFVLNPIFATFSQVPLYHFFTMFLILLTWWSYKQRKSFLLGFSLMTTALVSFSSLMFLPIIGYFIYQNRNEFRWKLVSLGFLLAIIPQWYYVVHPQWYLEWIYYALFNSAPSPFIVGEKRLIIFLPFICYFIGGLFNVLTREKD
jgi:hypothetical protein